MKPLSEGLDDFSGESISLGSPSTPLEWFASPRVILTGLIGFELLIVAAFLLDYWVGHPYEALTRFINLDAEANLPAWFSSMQLFAAGLVAALIGLSSRSKPVSRAAEDGWIWLTMAVIFLFLSMDEAAQFHELLGKVLSERMSGTGLKHGFWIVVFLPAGLAALGFGIWLLPRLFPGSIQARICFVAGCLLIIIGSAGLEIVSYGLERSLNSASYILEVSIEELSEMTGGTLTLYALLLRLKIDGPAIGMEKKPT